MEKLGREVIHGCDMAFVKSVTAGRGKLVDSDLKDSVSLFCAVIRSEVISL